MEPAPGRPTPTGVVIPIRAFRSGKARLAGHLDDDARAALAQHLAERVVAAAGPLPLVIVSGAPDVLAWAEAAGLTVIPDPGTGLDGAAAAGVDHHRTRGATRVIVAHADLAAIRPGQLASLATEVADTATIVPDHRDDGTPVIAIPTEPDFEFRYGPDSFRRHQAAARAVGWRVEIVRDAALGTDVDVPDDLTHVAEYTP